MKVKVLVVENVTIETLEDGMLLGKVTALSNNLNELAFEYEASDDRVHTMTFNKNMVPHDEYLRVTTTLALLAKEYNSHPDNNKSEFSSITEDLDDISKAIKVNVDKIHELEGDEIAEAVYELVEDNKEDIAEFLGTIQMVAENVAIIAKQSKKFIEEMDDDNKQVFVDMINTPELTPYKDLIADSHYRVAVLVDNVSELLKTKENELDSAETWSESVIKKWSTVKLFGIKRTFKMAGAFKNLSKLFN